MTEKLSAFTASVPAPTDYIAGATLGLPNKKFLIADLIPAPPALGNLNFYVATTGNDSNPGTISQPFATVQHAVDVLVSFNYQNQFFPAINIEDGTYTSATFITLPDIPGIGSGIAGINGNHTNPQNCVLSDGGAAFVGIFFAVGAAAVWGINDFEFQTADVAINTDLFASCNLGGNCRFNDVTNAGTGKPMQAFGGSNITFAGSTLTIVNSSIEAPFEVFANFSGITCGNVTINLPAATTLHVAWIYMSNFAFMTYRNVTVTNAGGITGPQVNMSNFALVETTNGALTDIVGSSSGNFIDSTSGITNTPGTTGGFFGFQVSGVPTGSNVTPGTWGVFKDTSGGGVYLAYNDAGTIKKVALV